MIKHSAVKEQHWSLLSTLQSALMPTTIAGIVWPPGCMTCDTLEGTPRTGCKLAAMPKAVQCSSWSDRPDVLCTICNRRCMAAEGLQAPTPLHNVTQCHSQACFRVAVIQQNLHGCRCQEPPRALATSELPALLRGYEFERLPSQIEIQKNPTKKDGLMRQAHDVREQAACGMHDTIEVSSCTKTLLARWALMMNGIDTDRQWSKHSSGLSDGSGRCQCRCNIACRLSANCVIYASMLGIVELSGIGDSRHGREHQAHFITQRHCTSCSTLCMSTTTLHNNQARPTSQISKRIKNEILILYHITFNIFFSPIMYIYSY